MVLTSLAERLARVRERATITATRRGRLGQEQQSGRGSAAARVRICRSGRINGRCVRIEQYVLEQRYLDGATLAVKRSIRRGRLAATSAID